MTSHSRPANRPSALLVRPVPISRSDDRESLSSWMFRLASANGFENYSQLLSNERIKVPHLATIDIEPSRWDLMAALHRLSLHPKEHLESHTLEADLSTLSAFSPIGNTRWVLTACTSKTVKGPRFMLCPACLATDEIPYWRAHWRLSVSTICNKHKTLLLDVCPWCHEPFTINGSRKAALTQCASCQSCLLGITPKARKVKRGAWLRGGPSNNIATDFPIPLSHSHLWWDGVRVLLAVFSRPKISKKLQCLDLPRPTKLFLQQLADGVRLDFDNQSVGARDELLNLVDWITQNWPSRFVSQMDSARISWTDFSACEVQMPYWLAKVCQTDLDRSRYQVTAGEVRAAAAFIHKQGRCASKIAVKRLLGVTEGRTLDIAYPPRKRGLSQAELLRVFQLIDSELHSAPTGREVQAVLLRDACCIAVATWNKVPFAKATKYELCEGHRLQVLWRDLADTTTEPGLLASLSLKWMELYLGGSRARFERFALPQTALFISRFGVPTKSSGLAGRFSKLLRRCNIPDWERGAHLLSGHSVDLTPQSESLSWNDAHQLQVDLHNLGN